MLRGKTMIHFNKRNWFYVSLRRMDLPTDLFTNGIWFYAKTKLKTWIQLTCARIYWHPMFNARLARDHKEAELVCALCTAFDRIIPNIIYHMNATSYWFVLCVAMVVHREKCVPVVMTQRRQQKPDKLHMTPNEAVAESWNYNKYNVQSLSPSDFRWQRCRLEM